MGEVSQISEFGKILIFLIVGSILVSLLFFVNRLIAPSNPTPEKLTSYECGEEPTGNAWLPFNSRFYVIALIFLLFEVEMVFVFPWATVFGSHELQAADHRWGLLSLIEMFVFLGILILGLVYVWAKGDLNWIKPQPIVPMVNSRVPQSLYDKLNVQQSIHVVKEFSLEAAPGIQSTQTAAHQPSSAAPPAPRFKPSFKKPSNDA